MPNIIESHLTGFVVQNGQQVPIGKNIKEMECNLAVATEDYETLGKFFKLGMMTGFDPGEGEFKFSGLNTTLKNMISNPVAVHELILTVNVREETAETMTGNATKRTYQMLINFMDDIPLIPSMSAQEQAEYTSKFNLRRLKALDNGAEVLYIDPYEDIYRVNRRNILEDM
jgi:phage tail tube protein FII